MKGNKKGLTLVELIISFAIVGIAVIYFYKTTSVVNELYTDSRKNTNYSAKKDYVARILSYLVDFGGYENVSVSDNEELIFDGKKIPVKGLTSISYEIVENDFTLNSFTLLVKFTFVLDGKTTTLVLGY